MAEKGPTPPYEFEPTDETERKYRVATFLVILFGVVLLTVAIVIIATW